MILQVMSDGIVYRGKMLGSVHYFVYTEGKLPGHKGDLYLRFNDYDSLETLLQLSPEDELEVGEENMNYEYFRREVLEKARDIHFDYNLINKPAPKISRVAQPIGTHSE